MSDYLAKLQILNDNKDKIIADVRKINIKGDSQPKGNTWGNHSSKSKDKGVSKTQAQNLREYATRTESIDELLLYIQYQCVREKELKEPFEELSKLITANKDKGIEVIRYMLGIFARWVMIESKRSE